MKEASPKLEGKGTQHTDWRKRRDRSLLKTIVFCTGRAEEIGTRRQLGFAVQSLLGKEGRK